MQITATPAQRVSNQLRFNMLYSNFKHNGYPARLDGYTVIDVDREKLVGQKGNQIKHFHVGNMHDVLVQFFIKGEWK